MTHRRIRRPFAARERPCLARVSAISLLACILVLLSLAGALAGSDSPAPVSEQGGRLPLSAVVKMHSNLRASPSMEGAILAIAREGTGIQVLGETERWYRVRTEGGIEAWIHKTLLLIPPVPLTSPPEAVRVPPPLPSADVQPLAAPKPSVASGSPSPEGEASPAPASAQVPLSAIQTSPAPLPADRSPPSRLFAYFQSYGPYLIGALLVVLIVSIGLQLRAAGQLKRAMREVDQILEVVEELRMGGAPAAGATGQAPTTFARSQAGVAPLLDLPPQLSPLERAVLEAIHEYGEIQERELAEKLKQRGFSGVLIKAVIGDIMRKTGSDSPPLLGVRRHAQGRYTYQLRRREVAGPAASEGGSEPHG